MQLARSRRHSGSVDDDDHDRDADPVARIKDRVRDNDRTPLPSFAQSFPPQEDSPSDQKSHSEKLPPLHAISRSHLRSNVSDSGPENPDGDRKRPREDRPLHPDDNDGSDDKSNSATPPGSHEGNTTANGNANPPRKKRKTATPSSAPQLTPPITEPSKRSPEPTKSSNIPGRLETPQKQNNGIGMQPLPAPPSFANRRGMVSSNRKGAPSELTLTPNAHTIRSIHPTIHSAPPVPASRLRLHQIHVPAPTPKGLPPAPTNTASVSIRRNNPKPTNISGNGPTAPSIPRPLPSASVGGGFKSTILPPTPTPTSNSFNPSLPLVPPTPSSLRHNIGQPPPRPQPAPQAAAAAGAKAAFMAPFESFYDTLADARTLKGWLQEQLTVARATTSNGAVNPAVIEEEVEKRVKPIRDELDWLRSRVGELEEIIMRMAPPNGGKVNGGLSARAAEKERETPSPMPSPAHSPIPSVRRTATSSTRLDPVPTRPRVPSPLGSKRELEGKESSKPVEPKMETE